ncbi:MAG: hypothetical protein EA417_08830 [Gammaproteobacteria bacterium]|nr:MAG: hypothetical protein EA417_08830 [Gammaproteobacteria bacterium]
MTDRKTENAQDDFETIAPAEVALTREAELTPAASDGRRRLLTWSAVVLFGLLFGGLLVMLPNALRPDLERIATGAESPPPGARERRREAGPAQQAEEENGDPVAPYQQSRLERERRAVEDLISRLLDLQDDLESRAVERWGADRLAAARALAASGDDAFIEERFDEARQRYQDAVSALKELQGTAKDAYESALQRGLDAIEDALSDEARDAYELALAIRPDSSAARRGLERAEVLDAVLSAVRDGEGHLAAGELEAARTQFEAALELDAETVAARQGLAEARSRIVTRAFNAALSRGYGALASGHLDTARDAFREALRLRSGSSEAEEGLLLVEQASTDRRIESLRQEATALMEDEQWTEAAQRYDEALELDGALSFARQGRSKARRLAALEERMLETLGQPDRLSEDVVLADARSLLRELRAVEHPRPGFAAHVAELEQLLEVAAAPVTVRLRSDGATEVTILRVARLGSFEERRIELRPGLYTATGSRPGYRDVRLEFRVAADGSGNPVIIRTEERI